MTECSKGVTALLLISLILGILGILSIFTIIGVFVGIGLVLVGLFFFGVALSLQLYSKKLLYNKKLFFQGNKLCKANTIITFVILLFLLAVLIATIIESTNH